MLAEEHQRHDVAIHWTNRARLAAILRSGKCPSHAVPRKLRKGGLVALVSSSGEVLLLFRLSKIDERISVIGADGQRYSKGCHLVAKRGTVRRPTGRDPRQLNVNRHAVGAFAYFEAETLARVIYSLDSTDPSSSFEGESRQRAFPSKGVPLFSNNAGKTLSQPERHLILAYARWVGDVAMFIQHPLKETGLYTDLFVPRRWTLFEAKASVSRRALREAVGQLFDYQRHYDRSPALAVLLPRRPAESVMGLFAKKRIAVVWRSTGGSFRDTVDGRLTRDLREEAR